MVASSNNTLTDLWQRLKIVLIAIVVYRIGVHIPLPNIDPGRLVQLFSDSQGSVLSLFNMFSGGALERMSIFALGIMPYISASIIMQLFSGISPHLGKLKKEGEEGQNKINQYTRYLTVLLSLIQALGLSVGLVSQEIATSNDIYFYFINITTLVCGAVFIMWLGEQITSRGIGNGISVLIFISIVSGLPGAIGQSFEQSRQGDISLLMLLFILVLIISIIVFIIFMERAQRRITLQYARKDNRAYKAQQSYLPLKINMAGVIPPIFASSILLFPSSLGKWLSGKSGVEWLQDLSLSLSPGQPLYMVLFSLAVMFFCFFYTSLMYKPKDIASNLKKSGAFIPGVRPGEQSANYIDSVATKLTLFGGFYIVLVSVLPQFLISHGALPFYLGGTSLLIVVVVVIDFMTQVQSYILSYQYGSFMDKHS